jgi:3-phenylpropionate/cinnamic acid dioxygenase small subunit
MAMNTEVDDELEAFLLERRVRQFLYREADILDQRNLEEWESLLHEEIDYKAPLRITREHVTNTFSQSAYYFDEDIGSLRARIDRFESEYAWSERPPSRTRRFVTNIRVTDTDDDTVQVTSNLLLYYSQGDSSDYTFLAGQRDDTLVSNGTEFTIRERTIYLDHTVPKIDKISVFL